MSAAKEEPVARLTPEAAALVETYFARVHGALLVSAVGGCDDTVGDLREHVLDELAGTAGTAADVTRVLAELGPPEALVFACAELPADPGATAFGAETKRSPWSGTLLGVPYELRPPTPDRVASRLWDPLDRHIFVPRLFGVGWTINFGALAVRLGIIRPDDEDVPFAAVPRRYLAIALVLPLVIAASLGVLVAVYQAALPAQVAVHYGLSGAPDRFASKESALILPVALTLLGTALVVVAWVRRHPALPKVATGALATLLSSISVAVYCQQVATAFGASQSAIVLGGLALSLALTFGLLVLMSRIGRAAEVRRDLDDRSTKGSV